MTQASGQPWETLANRVLEGDVTTPSDAMGVLESPDDELLSVLHAAFRVRAKYFGRDVSLHMLQNAKSGACPEDCSFCSQSTKAQSRVEQYKIQSVAELIAGAHRASRAGAVRYCMVTATRGPSHGELATICEATRHIKERWPRLQICTSLGLLDDAKAIELRAAGVDRFNHNLETSERFFPTICSTHAFGDRVATIEAARRAGMELCCGGIIGLGEERRDRVELAFELRRLEVDSIPVNFLDPRPGTPLAQIQIERTRPADCLRTLAMFRFVNPSVDLRIAGGREVSLRHMQPLALYPANSLFVDGYLTTGGQGEQADREMIADAGFRIVEELCAT